MAAAKANQQRRRMPQNKRNNMQKFKPVPQKRPNMRPPNMAFNPNFNNYNANQMADNYCGYVDFNEPAVRPQMGGGNNLGGPKGPNKAGGGPGMQRKQPNNRPMGQTNPQNRRRQQMPMQRQQGGGGSGGGMGGGNGGNGWNSNQNSNQQPRMPSRMPSTPPNMNQRPGPPGPPFRGGPMPPRMHPHPMGPMPPFHPPPPPMNGRFMGFGPRPGPPMPPPMMGPQWPPMPGMPRPMHGAMGPPRPLMGGGRPSGGNMGGNRMRRQQNNTNQKTQRKPTKAKGKIKPNVGKKPNQPQNQYPLEEPWVTQEIKDQHQKKQDLQNQLKGNRNDELFARFKSERDKFVALYDAAKAEYNKNKGTQEKFVDKTLVDNANGTDGESKPNGP